MPILSSDASGISCPAVDTFAGIDAGTSLAGLEFGAADSGTSGIHAMASFVTESLRRVGARKTLAVRDTGATLANVGSGTGDPLAKIDASASDAFRAFGTDSAFAPT